MRSRNKKMARKNKRQRQDRFFQDDPYLATQFTSLYEAKKKEGR